MIVLRGSEIWKRAWRRVVAVVVCLGILFSTLVDATSHAAHAGHGHTPHTIAVMANTDQVTNACEQSATGCSSESDQRSSLDQHGLLDPAHCCLVFVWMPIPELIAPQVHRLSLVRRNDAPRATISQDFERPPKPLL
jgi:hypothetical protein